MATTQTEYRTFRGMAGTLFPALNSKQDAEQYRISESLVNEFHNRGFIKGPRVLNAKQIDALREGLERIRTGENPRLAELYEIDDAWKSAPGEFR